MNRPEGALRLNVVINQPTLTEPGDQVIFTSRLFFSESVQQPGVILLR